MDASALKLERVPGEACRVLLGDHLIGQVRGERRQWEATSADGFDLGSFGTRAEAVAAISNDAHDPAWAAMTTIAAVGGITQKIGCDLEKHRLMLRQWRGHTDFLWIVEPTRSQLIPMSTSWDRPRARQALSSLEEGFVGSIYRVGVLDGHCCQSVTLARAWDLVGRDGREGLPCRYTLDPHQRVVRGGRRLGLAQLDVVWDEQHPKNLRHATVRVRMTAALDSESYAMLCAGKAFVHEQFGDPLVEPARVEVLGERGKILAVQERPH